MKNLIIYCAMACLAAFTCIDKSYAQNAKPRFGIKAGIDMMTLGTNNTNGVKFSYDYRLGFQAGIYADVPLCSQLSFLPQVLYTQKGGSINNALAVANYNINTKTKVNYLEVPLLIGFKPQHNLTLSAGPQVAFLLSQETYLNLKDGSSSSGINSNTKSGFRKTLIGANVGVGYLLTNNIGVNLNYSIDFQHLGNGSVKTSNGERNSGFALTASCLF